MTESFTLGTLVRVLFRHWVLLLIGTVLGGVSAFGVTQLMTPVYTATATQLVKSLPGRDIAANYEASQYAAARAKSYPSFIDSPSVLEGVRADMGNRQSIAELRDDLSAENPVDTPLLLISATGNTPAEARDKANSAARHMARFITQIETVAGKSPIGVETAVEAALPTRPTSPRVVLLTTLGAVIGFILAAGIALIHSVVLTDRLGRAQTLAPGWELTDRDSTADGALESSVPRGRVDPSSSADAGHHVADEKDSAGTVEAQTRS